VDETTGEVLLVALVKGVRSQVGVLNGVGEEVIRDGQAGVAERDGRFLLAAPRDEPVVRAPR
jgi:hypothetical protein